MVFTSPCPTDNNTKMVKLILDYTNKNNNKQEINAKNKWRKHQLLYSTYHNNIELVKLLIDYVTENRVILELNGFIGK